MANSDNIRVIGIIKESLPNAEFRLDIHNYDPEKGLDETPLREIVARTSGKMRLNHIRILPGDYVVVEITPYDLNRGRIVYRGRDAKSVQSRIQPNSDS